MVDPPGIPSLPGSPSMPGIPSMPGSPGGPADPLGQRSCGIHSENDRHVCIWLKSINWSEKRAELTAFIGNFGVLLPFRAKDAVEAEPVVVVVPRFLVANTERLNRHQVVPGLVGQGLEDVYANINQAANIDSGGTENRVKILKSRLCSIR